MPATPSTTASGVGNAVLGTVFGPSVISPQVNPPLPPNLDILQILVPGDNSNDAPLVALNVDFRGVVHNPAVAPTKGTRMGVFYAIDLTTGATTAQLFASVWKWNATQGAQADIFQVVNQGGNISYWLDFLGVARGS
jgi:hypothetical protein